MKIIVKLILSLMIFQLLILTINFDNNIYAESSQKFLKVEAMTPYVLSDTNTLETDWMTIEILKQAHDYTAFTQTFTNYTIVNGFVDVVLGLDQANPIEPTLFDDPNNWIKITIQYDEGIPEPVIITLNTVARSLFAFQADETPTGNLFPGIKNFKNHFIMINDTSDRFEYISTSTILDLIDLKNPSQINQFFAIDPENEGSLLIVDQKKHNSITTKTILQRFDLDSFFRFNEIPNIKESYRNSYIRVAKDSLGLEFAPIIASSIDIETLLTANLFVGSPSEINNVFMWNPALEAFEATPSIKLGFVDADNQINVVIDNEESDRIQEDDNLRVLIASNDAYLQQQIEQEHLDSITEDTLIMQEIASQDAYLSLQISLNKHERIAEDELLSVSINSIIDLYQAADDLILGQIQALDTAFRAADQVLVEIISQNKTNDISPRAALDLRLSTINMDYSITDESLQLFLTNVSVSSNTAEGLLLVSLNSLVDLYKDVDSQLQVSINSNDAFSDQLEADLVISINTISDRFIAIDQALQASIDAYELLSDTEEARIASEMVSLNNAYKLSDSILMASISQNYQENKEAVTEIIISINTLNSAYKLADDELATYFSDSLAESLVDIGAKFVSEDELIQQLIDYYELESESEEASVGISINAMITAYELADSVIQAMINQDYSDAQTREDDIRLSINTLIEDYTKNDADLEELISTNKSYSDGIEQSLRVSMNALDQAYQLADSVILADIQQNKADSDLENENLSTSINRVQSNYITADTNLESDLNQNNANSIMKESNLRVSINQLNSGFKSADLDLQQLIDEAITNSILKDLALIASINLITNDFNSTDSLLRTSINLQEITLSSNLKGFSDDITALESNLSAESIAIQASYNFLEDLITQNNNYHRSLEEELFVSLSSFVTMYKLTDTSINDKISSNNIQNDTIENQIKENIDTLESAYKLADILLAQQIATDNINSDLAELAMTTSLNEIINSYEQADSDILVSINMLDSHSDAKEGQFIASINLIEVNFPIADATLEQKILGLDDELISINAKITEEDVSLNTFLISQQAIITARQESINSSMNEFLQTFSQSDFNVQASINALDLILDGTFLKLEGTSTSINLAQYFDDTVLNQTQVVDHIQSTSLTFADNKAININYIQARDSDGLFLANQNEFGIFISNQEGIGIGTQLPEKDLDVSGDVKAAAFIGNGSGLTDINAPINSIGTVQLMNGAITNEKILFADWSKLTEIPAEILDGDDNTLYSNYVGASQFSDGVAGLVHAPLFTDNEKFLQGNGTWGIPTHNHPYSPPIHYHDYLKSSVNEWSVSVSDGKARLYLNSNAETKFKAGKSADTLFLWERNDTTDLVLLKNDGTIWSRIYGNIEDYFAYQGHMHPHTHTDKSNAFHAHTNGNNTYYLNGTGNWSIPPGYHNHPYSDPAHTHNYIGNTVDTWQNSTDQKGRFNFNTDSLTIFGSGHDGNDLFVWRNYSDQNVMKLNSSGQVWTSGYGWLHDYFSSSSHNHSGVYSETTHTHLNPSDSTKGDEYIYNGNANWVPSDSIPIHGIALWSGSVASIPAGWALCDGRTVNGKTTPDLRGKFIAGYDPSISDYNTIGNTGGTASTTISLPQHGHSASSGTQSSNHSHSGTSNNGSANHNHVINDNSHTMSIATKQDDWNGTGAPHGYQGWSHDGLNAHTTSNLGNAGSHNHGGATGNSGGEHNHAFSTDNNDNSHQHSASSISSVGSGTAFDNRPNYYVLAYIMKI